MDTETLKLLLALEVQSIGEKILGEIGQSLHVITQEGGGLTGVSANLMSVGKELTAVGAGMMVVGAAAAATIGVLTKQAASYQELTTVLVTGAGETHDNLAMVSQGMLDMAGQVGVGANDLAKGMYMIESAGFHGADGLEVLKASAEGAKIGMADQSVVADALTTILKDYKLGADDALGVTGQMTAAVAAGKMHWQDFAQSLSAALPLAAALNIPFQQIAAAEAVMTAHGVAADTATQGLRFALTGLIHPSDSAIGGIKALGISVDALQAKLASGDFTGALQMFGDAMNRILPASARKAVAEAQKEIAEGFDPETIMATLESKAGPAYAGFFKELTASFGGARGGVLALNLIPNLDEYRADLASIGTVSEGAAKQQEAWATVQKDLNTQVSMLGAGVSAAAISLGQAFLPQVTQVVKEIVPMVKGIGDWIAQHKQLTASVLEVIAGFGLFGGALVTIAGLGLIFAPMSAAIMGLLSPLWSVIAVCGALYLAWQSDFGGIREITQGVFNWITGTGIPGLQTGIKILQGAWGDLSDNSRMYLGLIATALLTGGPLLSAVKVAYTGVVAFGGAFTALRVIAMGELALIAAKVLVVAEAAYVAGQALKQVTYALSGGSVSEGMVAFTPEGLSQGFYEQVKGITDSLGGLSGELIDSTGVKKTWDEAMASTLAASSMDQAGQETQTSLNKGKQSADDLARALANVGSVGGGSSGPAAATTALNAMKQSADAATTALRQLVNLPLAGTGAFNDKIAALQQEADKTQLAMLTMKNSGLGQDKMQNPDSGPTYEMLKQRYDSLQEQIQMAQLEMKTQQQPIKQELGKMLASATGADQEFSPDQIKSTFLAVLQRRSDLLRGVVQDHPELSDMGTIKAASAKGGTTQDTLTTADITTIQQTGKDLATNLGAGFNAGLLAMNLAEQLINTLTEQIKKVKIDIGPWHLSSAGFELQVTVTAPGSGGAGSGSGGSSGIPGHAAGGLAWSPHLAMIAEKEPELITPLSQVRSMFGGGNNSGGSYSIGVTVAPGAVQVTGDAPNNAGQLVGDAIAGVLEQFAKSALRISPSAAALLPGNPG